MGLTTDEAAAAVRDHASRFGDLHLQCMELGVAGWTFFEGDDRAVHDGGRGYWVVRDDGSVVAGTDAVPMEPGDGLLEPGDPRTELRRVFESLAVLDEQVAETPALPDAVAEGERLGRIALALNGGDVVFVNQFIADQFAETFDGVVTPRWERHDDGGTLQFSARSSGRSRRAWTYTVAVAADYGLAVEREECSR